MSKFRAASRRRAKSIRGALALLMLGAALAACGHYGPPVRASRAKSEATANAPAPGPTPTPAAQPAQSQESKKDE
jgi:hypothetical protein